MLSLLNYLIDLQSFREGLAVLQRQVDDLDELKLTHYQQIVEHEEDVWNVVQGKVSETPPWAHFVLKLI